MRAFFVGFLMALAPLSASHPTLPTLKNGLAFTDEEIFCVTTTVLGEAGHESKYGKHLVAMVIVNRSLRNNRHLNLCAVINEPNQFMGKGAVVSLTSNARLVYFMDAYDTTRETLQNYNSYPAEERRLIYFNAKGARYGCRGKHSLIRKEGGHCFYADFRDFE